MTVDLADVRSSLRSLVYVSDGTRGSDKVAFLLRSAAEMEVELRSLRQERAELVKVARQYAGLDGGIEISGRDAVMVAELMGSVLGILDRRTGGLSLPVSPDSSLLSLGPVSYDVVTMEAKVGSKAIPLSPSQRKLLELLLRNANRVVSSDQIIDTCSREGLMGGHEKNYAQSLISSFRRDFLDHTINVEIRTVRGVGYQLRLAPAVVAREAGR